MKERKNKRMKERKKEQKNERQKERIKKGKRKKRKKKQKKKKDKMKVDLEITQTHIFKLPYFPYFWQQQNFDLEEHNKLIYSTISLDLKANQSQLKRRRISYSDVTYQPIRWQSELGLIQKYAFDQ